MFRCQNDICITGSASVTQKKPHYPGCSNFHLKNIMLTTSHKLHNLSNPQMNQIKFMYDLSGSAAATPYLALPKL